MTAWPHVQGQARIGRGCQIHPTAVIGPGVQLESGCIVEAYAVVGRPPRRGYTARDPGEAGLTRIGMGCQIGCHAVIYAGVTIGQSCLIGDHVLIREGVIIGDGAALHWGATINYESQVGVATTIGNASHITGRMQIGARCFFGPGVQTANDMQPLQGYDPERIAGPVVESDVLVGAGAILLPGSRVRRGATIGAGALVGGEVPAGATVLAVPARRVPGRQT
jgi:UDP-3-O-[3-hydroxymyristoyl] glucosamine N-acyltransferase